MFRYLQRRLADMRTIRDLCLAAERHARADGQAEPGPEHFLLAALDLPDGTARRAFERVGTHPELLRPAIAQQYIEALARIGIRPDALAAPAPLPGAASGVYRAQPQVASLMRALQEKAKGTALTGAHVVSAVAAMPHGVAARALAGLGVDARALGATADALAHGG